MMAERNAYFLWTVSRKSLFCLFIITSVLFVLSWFFVLLSASHDQLIEYGLLPHPKLLVTFEGRDHENQSQNDSIRYRSILVNGEEKEAARAMQDNVAVARCSSEMNLPLKVYMYDLPAEFHFELLGWKAEGDSVWPDIRSIVPSYPGGLNLQHSIEYWLTLDLLASEHPELSSRRAGAAIRVRNSSEADVVFVPFFSSLSYNRYSKVNPHQKTSRNKVLQAKLVSYLTAQEEWKRSGGVDHVVLAHHPNSMLDARMKLWPAMLILSDFGRYPPRIANVDKDVIAPYKHVIKSYLNDSSDFDSRPTLLYFQGAIYRKDGGLARQELFYLLKDEKDVHFSFGSVLNDGVNKATRGMHSSKFCLNIAGDTPSSNRLFDAIVSHCVPVIISDDIELPYEDVLDYAEFCIFVRTSDAVKENFLVSLIRGVGKEEWTRMWGRMKEVEHMFEFHYPSRDGDAVQMIWQAIARKVPAIRMKLNKSRRYGRFSGLPEKGVTKLPMPSNFW